jgi:L-fucose isomerase-like protein
MSLRKTLTLGVAPVKRSFLPMDAAKAEKDRFMKVISGIRPDIVKIVDIDDLSENGIAFDNAVVPSIIKKFKDAEVDALFIPFCDFGEESVAAAVAAAFKLPTLVWGARDEFPNTLDVRGRDTQCGIFAATKVMRRNNVKFSYIYNVRTEDDAFKDGYLNFIRFANVVKDLNGLQLAKIGNRPGPFWSVLTNEADLLTKLNIQTIPIGPAMIMATAEELRAKKDEVYLSYLDSLKKRFDLSAMDDEKIEKSAALKVAVGKSIQDAGASVAAFECWSAFFPYGVVPCVLLGDLTDEGIPLACECDINGAVSQAILRAVNLYDESPFLADLTIRNPQNENSELLWHCGPFPYSLKDDASSAALVEGQEQFYLKQGELTLARFDDIDGDYILFTGEGKTTTGPETMGTYVWLEVDNWKRWEEKLVYGPYIHHIGGVYGKYLPALREVARYLGIQFDNAHEQGIYSL